MRRARVGVLISGRGSNMMALVKAARAADYPAHIVCVASNNPQAEGLEFARAQGLASHALEHRQFARRETFDETLNAYLQSQKLDIIACAGFMRIMTPVLIAPWSGRMINIHPSLLPLYKGRNTHERALADGQKQSGCTVHYVTSELDAGPIIAQSQVPILADDTPASLAARILIEEHKLYPKALAMVAEGLVP